MIDKENSPILGCGPLLLGGARSHFLLCQQAKRSINRCTSKQDSAHNGEEGGKEGGGGGRRDPSVEGHTWETYRSCRNVRMLSEVCTGWLRVILAEKPILRNEQLICGISLS